MTSLVLLTFKVCAKVTGELFIKLLEINVGVPAGEVVVERSYESTTGLLAFSFVSEHVVPDHHDVLRLNKKIKSKVILFQIWNTYQKVKVECPRLSTHLDGHLKCNFTTH